MVRMTAKLSIVLSSVWVASLGACGSGSSGPLPIDATAFGEKYKIADNEITGWTQDSAFDAFWAGTDLITGADLDGSAETLRLMAVSALLAGDQHQPGFHDVRHGFLSRQILTPPA